MQELEDIRRRFAGDIYATETTGITIEDARRDYARCVMPIDARHFNANGTVMGGAIYTLADFAFAVAANTDNPQTVPLSAAVNYLGAAKGAALIAEAVCLKSGRTTTVVRVDVKDDLNNAVASVTVTGYRKE